MAKSFSYGKKEKLKSRKQLTALFDSRQSFFLFPLKVFYIQPVQMQDHIVKAAVGVNSRNFKKAVDRNRIKRVLREAYRLAKLPLHQYLEEHNQQLAVFFLYIDKSLPQKGALQNKMSLIIQELIKRLHENASENT